MKDTKSVLVCKEYEDIKEDTKIVNIDHFMCKKLIKITQNNNSS